MVSTLGRHTPYISDHHHIRKMAVLVTCSTSTDPPPLSTTSFYDKLVTHHPVSRVRLWYGRFGGGKDVALSRSKPSPLFWALAFDCAPMLSAGSWAACNVVLRSHPSTALAYLTTQSPQRQLLQQFGDMATECSRIFGALENDNTSTLGLVIG